MTPEHAIAMLDAQLAKHGETVILRRVVGLAPGTPYDVTVRAMVRGYDPARLVGDMVEIDSRVTISPSEIAASNWPNGDAANIPRRQDKVVIGGVVKNVEASSPIRMNDVLVRIDLRVRG